MLDKLIADLQSASQGVIDDAMINRGAGWIDELKNEFPWVYEMLMGMLYKSPEYVLSGLILLNKDLAPYRDNKHALAYIAALQGKLRGAK